MAKYTFVVMTNPTTGKEAEFNEWYNTHLHPRPLNTVRLPTTRHWFRPI
jgi:hypothetical protein